MPLEECKRSVELHRDLLSSKVLRVSITTLSLFLIRVAPELYRISSLFIFGGFICESGGILGFLEGRAGWGVRKGGHSFSHYFQVKRKKKMPATKPTACNIHSPVIVD